jgi:hypothetical protein
MVKWEGNAPSPEYPFASNTSRCFALNNTADQVQCNAESLNIYNPPSEYSYVDYTSLWEPITCLLYNVSYSSRVNSAAGELSEDIYTHTAR